MSFKKEQYNSIVNQILNMGARNNIILFFLKVLFISIVDGLKYDQRYDSTVITIP